MRTNVAHVAACLALFFAGAQCGRAAATVATNDEPLKVVVVYGALTTLPRNQVLDQALRNALVSGANRRIEFYSEKIESSPLGSTKSEPEYVALLRKKYQDLKVDLVLADTTRALDFVERHREEFWPTAPVIFYNIDEADLLGRKLSSGITGQPASFDVGGTLELAVRLQPDARHLVVVGGLHTRDRYWNDRAAEEISRYEGKLQTTWLTNQTLSQILRAAGNLPPKTIVVYTSLAIDASGQNYTSYEVLKMLTGAANAPVYGLNDVFVGQGVVGGSVSGPATQGQLGAQLALRVLAGEKPDAIPVQPPPKFVPTVDWQQLQRWHLSEERLPPGSVVLFRAPTLWEQHKDYVIGGMCVIFVQALTITLLLVQGRRRKQAQRALLESEERMKLAADAAQLGVWIGDVPTQRVWTSETCNRLFGYPPNIELSLADLRDRVHSEDRTLRQHALEQALTNTGKYDHEYRVLLPDGSVRWLASVGRVDRDALGKPMRIRGVVVDITERRNAENAARDLGGRLINAQEDERHRIARELHDDLSQRLALLSVELEMFGQQPPAQREAIAGRMVEFSGMVKHLSSDIHRLAHELHPAKLDQLGLVAAARGFCKELAAAHQIAIAFAARDVPRTLPDAVALCLYRITQEALQNVIKHSGATSAQVELTADATGLQLSITDDGHGFDPKAMPAKCSLGIVSMRERVRMVQGQITVQSRPGEGTRIEVRVPIMAPAGGADDVRI